MPKLWFVHIYFTLFELIVHCWFLSHCAWNPTLPTSPSRWTITIFKNSACTWLLRNNHIFFDEKKQADWWFHLTRYHCIWQPFGIVNLYLQSVHKNIFASRPLQTSTFSRRNTRLYWNGDCVHTYIDCLTVQDKFRLLVFCNQTRIFWDIWDLQSAKRIAGETLSSLCNVFEKSLCSQTRLHHIKRLPCFI